MKVVLDHVTKGAALPATSASFETGRATLARAETEQRPTVLGLIASGRMRPDGGSVTIDGAADSSAMRRRIALIDAPDVSEPASDVTVGGIVAEELMFAGRPSHPVAVSRCLRELGASDWARHSIGTVPPMVRIRLLAELALLRRGVDALVLVSPDRHGGDPVDWWRFARELAGRDKAVLVVAGDASAAAIAAASLVSRMDETDPNTFDEDPGRDDTDDLPDLIVTEPLQAEPIQEEA
ncbi:hypothetical protein [Leifsonia sp. fls2-241-R2A-40a]|uniref:hypothetical protein n=1 Tax=Leifsonia sp. fls2-241-R2A-40a TaxID=3040290 RepID=UPI00254EF4B9|nr:hypothetical protein [Leifsonia sp. fls2-241-R2A-40a]